MYRGLDIAELANAVSARPSAPKTSQLDGSLSDDASTPAPSPLKSKVAFLDAQRRDSLNDETPPQSERRNSLPTQFTRLVDRRNSGTRRKSSVTSVQDLDMAMSSQNMSSSSAVVGGGSATKVDAEVVESGGASSRWRVFGALQRPAPEWRRKPSLAVSKFLEESKRRGSTTLPDQQDAFELGQSYREGRMDATQRKSVTSLSATSTRRTSSASQRAPPKVTTIIGLSEEEVNKRLARAIATTELECLEKYERALLESAEREATFVVAARHAVVERDAARELLGAKNKRIMELEALVETLAQRFLFFGGASSSGNLLNRGDGVLEQGALDARPQPIPVLVDGELPYESTRPGVVPRANRSTEDRKLVTKLRDAIAAFERKQQQRSL